MSDASADSAGDDGLPPGDAEPQEDGARRAVMSYLVGLVLAAGLSAASFLLPQTGLVFAPALPVALVVMAIAQMGVHLVFFLHVTTAPDNSNTVLALAFGVLIVFLLLAGSLWIMDSMNGNMLPMQPH